MTVTWRSENATACIHMVNRFDQSSWVPVGLQGTFDVVVKNTLVQGDVYVACFSGSDFQSSCASPRQGERPNGGYDDLWRSATCAEYVFSYVNVDNMSAGEERVGCSPTIVGACITIDNTFKRGTCKNESKHVAGTCEIADLWNSYRWNPGKTCESLGYPYECSGTWYQTSCAGTPLSAGCRSCLDACRGMSSCCTGVGCICQSSCS